MIQRRVGEHFGAERIEVGNFGHAHKLYWITEKESSSYLIVLYKQQNLSQLRSFLLGKVIIIEIY